MKYLQIFFITNIIVDRDVLKQKAFTSRKSESQFDSATYEACHPEYVNIPESEIT